MKDGVVSRPRHPDCRCEICRKRFGKGKVYWTAGLRMCWSCALLFEYHCKEKHETEGIDQ